jgi:hypothetical protein
VGVLQTDLLAKRLIAEIVDSLQAEGAALYVSRVGTPELVQSSAGWQGHEVRLRLPLRCGDELLGEIVVGPRRDGAAYSPRDQAALQEVATVAAEALRLAARLA